MSKELLKITDLHVNAEEKEILKGINLKINKGEIHVIMGPNGSGKTTTANAIKIFEFKDELKKYMEDLNMNPKNMERSLNVGFSGGEKKKNEILQMLVLNPKLAILDETDSGLDVDAIKTVSKGIEMFKNDENAVLIITHNNKILHSLKVDYVHVLVDGKIVATGTQELATEIEENGYSKYKKWKIKKR